MVLDRYKTVQFSFDANASKFNYIFVLSLIENEMSLPSNKKPFNCNQLKGFERRLCDFDHENCFKCFNVFTLDLTNNFFHLFI